MLQERYGLASTQGYLIGTSTLSLQSEATLIWGRDNRMLPAEARVGNTQSAHRGKQSGLLPFIKSSLVMENQHPGT
jgi:hypothetical protein